MLRNRRIGKVCVAERDFHCQVLWLKERQRLYPKDFTSCLRTLKLTDTRESCPGCAALASHGKATTPHNDECRERIRTIIERTLTGKASLILGKALESFEERAQEVWKRNWMSLEMQTTLLNTYPPKLIATILKALREQLKEHDKLDAVEEIAGTVPESPLEYDQILKEGGKFLDVVNGGYLPEDLVLAARREEIDWVHSKGVYEIVPMQ